jgi:hypothetical protein
LTRESGEWNWHVELRPQSDLNLLRQGQFGVPRSRTNGVNIVVRSARVKRVDERVATESGERRGLSEKHVALCECGLVGDGIFG